MMLSVRLRKAYCVIFVIWYAITNVINTIAIVIFTLFQSFVDNGHTEVNVRTAIDMFIALLGIGIGSVLLAACICFTSAFLLRVSITMCIHRTRSFHTTLTSSYHSVRMLL
jgi:hypothetical protein